MNAHVLQLPDFSRPFFIVVTDASGKGLGAILMQDDHPIAFESRKFKLAESKYSIYDKVLSAVVHALKMWKHYLMGFQFMIKTDQQSIKHLLSQPLISNWHIKWAAFIQSFQPIIQYQPGKGNVVAGALSRRLCANNISVLENVTFDAMKGTYVEDSDFNDICSNINDSEWMLRNHYSHDNGYLFYNRKLCITQPFRHSVMEELHQPPYVGHRGISSTFQTNFHDFYWSHI